MGTGTSASAPDRAASLAGLLMAIVFVSRLIPDVSFDAVSYAVGLAPLAFGRFAVATLFGVIPASHSLTYLSEVLAIDQRRCLSHIGESI